MQGILAIVGAILFPAGFVILVPLAGAGHRLCRPAGRGRGARFDGPAAAQLVLGLPAICWAFAYALLFYLAITNCGQNNGGPMGDL